MDQFTGSYNMLKHGLRPVILIFTIIHVTLGGITETKGLVFDFLIFSQFSLIFSHKRNCYTEKLNNLAKFQMMKLTKSTKWLLFFNSYLLIKAMKSSPLLGPFGDSEFWEFSLFKVYAVHWFTVHTLLSSWLLSEIWYILAPKLS